MTTATSPTNGPRPGAFSWLALLPAWSLSVVGLSLSGFPMIGLLGFFLIPMAVAAWLHTAWTLPKAPDVGPAPHVLLTIGLLLLLFLAFSALRTSLWLSVAWGALAAALELGGTRWRTGQPVPDKPLVFLLFAGFGPAVYLLVRFLRIFLATSA